MATINCGDRERVLEVGPGDVVVERPLLMNLFWSAAGVYPMESEISPFDFERRAKSAASAGFAGMSFWHTDLAHILETRALSDVKSILDDNGLSTYEVEFIEDWFVVGDRRAASDKRRHALLEASAALGAHHVKVGDFHNTPGDMPQLVDAFGALCADADAHGAVVGFEFMASSMIHRLKDCLAMVEGANAPNGGLIVDIAHTNALGISNSEVSQIPGRYMISAELGDNLRRTSPGYTPAERRYCGEGELDIPGFVDAVRSTGYSGPWAVEVFNHQQAGWPVEKLDEVAYRTTLPFLA